MSLMCKRLCEGVCVYMGDPKYFRQKVPYLNNTSCYVRMYITACLRKYVHM